MDIQPVLNQNYANSQIKIKVLGVGGAGGNTVNSLIEKNLTGVEYIAANTDWGDLKKSKADVQLQLGRTTSRGHGAGANREIGKKAAEESRDEIIETFKDADMVFLIAGLGKGTGTGASPAIVDIIKSIDRNSDTSDEKLVVAIVFYPFKYEGKRRKDNADEGLKELSSKVDTLIVIPNEKIHEEYPKETLIGAFKKADEIIYLAAKAVTDLLLKKGYMEVDFRDIITVMGNKGYAYITSWEADGDNRALEAATKAMENPLLSDIELTDSKGLLINVTAGSDLPMGEFYKALDHITQKTGTDGDIIHGYVVDEELQKKARVTLIATGLNIKKEVPYKVGADVITTSDEISITPRKHDWKNEGITDIDIDNTSDQNISIKDNEEADNINNGIPAFFKKYNND